MSNARDKANIPALNFSSSGIDDNATSTAITINSSGNVGIGTSSPTEKLEVYGTETTGGVEILLHNVGTDGGSTVPYTAIKSKLSLVRNGGEIRFGRDGTYGSASTSDSNLQFYTALDDVNTERMRITSTGNVGIGTSSPGRQFEISSTNPYLSLKSTDTSTGTSQIFFGDTTDDNVGRINYQHSDNSMLFLTSATEAMRIDSSGNVGIGTTSPGDKLDVNGKILSTSLDVSGTLRATKDSTAFDSAGYHQILGSTTSYYTLKILNKASSPSVEYITEVSFASGSPDNSGAKFFQMRDSTTARVNINSDGDLQNHDNSYGAISDERIKQNIVDAGSQWEDIKNIRVRKYKKKDDVLQYGEANAPIELGVISQELETVSPGLIKEDKPDISHVNMHPDFTGDNPQNVKYVKYSILYMKAIKALQEAMERIETLEAKVQTLETNQP